MADVVKTKVMHEHAIPVTHIQLLGQVSSHIVVYFSKILISQCLSGFPTIRWPGKVPLTETKKLDVPSARANVSGKSFSQVSSPYMINFPFGLSFNCASHVS